MPTLTTPFNLGNGSRIVFGTFAFDDDKETVTVPVEIRTPPGAAQPDALIYAFLSVVKNGGLSTVHTRVATPPGGSPLEAGVRYVTESTRSLPTGYDAAVAARDAATPKNKAARRTALEAHWLSAGHIAANLGYGP